MPSTESTPGSLLERGSAFIEAVIAPSAVAMARGDGPTPEALVRSAGEHGLAGILIPEEFGGGGADHRAFTAFIEALARVDASSSVILDVHLSVGTEPLLTFGSDEQRRRFLPAVASGRCPTAFCLTEPGSGSDARALATRAERDGDGYRITGTKAFITNSGAAGLYVVMARHGDGPRDISAFLVEGDSPGLSFGEPLRKLGLRGSRTAEVVLDAVAVPASHRLGREGEGFAIAMATLDSGRIGISAQAVGIAQGCLDAMHAAGAERTLDEMALADVAARTAASRLLTAHAAALADAGIRATQAASVAKLFGTDTAMFAAHTAVEQCAPESARELHPASIRLRDAKACQIYEGTNQVQRLVIARRLLPS
ncbi:MAG: acyl-CoA dehydrogenase family protein [Candidatus Dormibacteria bacterium]